MRPSLNGMNLRHRKNLLEEQMRVGALAVLAIVALLLAGTAAAQDRDPQWNRCTVYDEHGRLRTGVTPDLVIDACTAIIQSDQKSKEELAAAFANRGYVYRNKRDYDHAIQDLDQAIKLDPNNALAFTNRGEAYANKREYDHAIQDLDQAIRLDPNNARALNDRGGAQDYDQAIRLDPNSPPPSTTALCLLRRAQVRPRHPRLTRSFSPHLASIWAGCRPRINSAGWLAETVADCGRLVPLTTISTNLLPQPSRPRQSRTGVPGAVLSGHLCRIGLALMSAITTPND
jgi:tetratricopeptide (TPR) repeat protein